MRQTIRFLHRGEVVTLDHVDPNRTLLDWLRLEARRTGTKEGCNEGDCGACTVALGRVEDGKLVYRPVNACILLLGQCDGAEVVTVDDLAEGGELHPVQKAMVDHHASQCGFCTPGFVMSLFTLYQDGGTPGRAEVNDRIAGNLCRCTGYRPIVEAALAACHGRPADGFARRAAETAKRLGEIADRRDVFLGDDERFFASPKDVDGLAALYEAHPKAVLLAGGTDVGLWITKQLRDLPKVIWLGRVAGLDTIEETENGLLIGSAVTYARAEAMLGAIDPDIAELVRRIGSVQVRSSGTIGGNIANGSPIGDTPPALIALGATLELRRGREARALPLEDFFLAYGKQDRRPGEFVSGIFVPKLGEAHRFRAYKVSKRFDQDITAVLGAIRLTVDGARVMGARIAFGGMAATPRRATLTEQALIGADLTSPASWVPTLKAIADDFDPIDDMRASAAYRRETAKALVGKALVEIAGTPTTRTRVVGRRETTGGAVERVA